jgi:hypothetical protein
MNWRTPKRHAAVRAIQLSTVTMSDPDRIEAEFRGQMQGIADAIDEVFNGKDKYPHKRVGFVLLLFKYGDAAASRANYISNGASRKDIAVLFREMAARFEGQPDIVGRA